MNILYIGPYKNISIDGIASRYLIDSLKLIPNINLTIQNIIIDNKINNSFSYSEEKISGNLESFDIVIQHAPVDMIVNDSRIKKLIIFPIMDVVNEKIINMLSIKKFDKLLVNSKYHLDKLKKVFGSKVTYLRYNKTGIPINKRYNIKFLNKTQKFYCVSSYKKEQNIIRKIILSFMMAFRTNPTVSLILFLEDKPSELEQLNKDIAEYKKQLNLINDFKKITIAPFDNTEESLLATHNSGDIYLSTIISESNIHCDIAQLYKKKILYLDRVDSATIPSESDYTVGDTITSPLTISLAEEMRRISSDTNKNQYFLCDSKYIKDIINKL
jgi:hypothetical protein